MDKISANLYHCFPHCFKNSNWVLGRDYRFHNFFKNPNRDKISRNVIICLKEGECFVDPQELQEQQN